MAINISSRTIELIIGSQDWSQWIDFDAGIQVGYPEYQVGSGLLIVSGSITLKFAETQITSIPSSPYYRFNPSQWKRGQTISIRIGGTYLPCSGRLLYIIKPPQHPQRNINGSMTLTLEIGCRLALDNFPPEPSRNIAGVEAGISTDRATIIGRILNYISVPNSISGMPYPIDYPLPKTDGNWIQFAGKIADSAGYHLRCDEFGTVRNYENQVSLGGSSFFYTIGTNEKSWQSIGDVSEQPIEKLVVTGIKQNILPVPTENTVDIEEKPIGQLLPDINWSNPTSLAVSKRTTKEANKDFLANNTSIITVTETIEEPIGVILPDINWSFPTSLNISTKTTTQNFLTKGIVTRIVTTEEKPLGVILPDINWSDPSSLTTSKKTTTSWARIRDGLWEKTETILEPLGFVIPDINWSFPSSLTESSVKITQDTTGAPTSLGTETSTNTTEETQFTVDVFAVQLANDIFRERQRTIDVPYAINEQQLFAYGQAYNRFLSGRAFGWQFGGVFAAIDPFTQIQVTDGSSIYFLRADAIQYAFNGTEAYTLWNGIEVGVANVATPSTIVAPVLIPIGKFELVGTSIANAIYPNLAFDRITGESIAQTTWLIPIGFDVIVGVSNASILYQIAIFFNTIVGTSLASVLNAKEYADIVGTSASSITYSPISFGLIDGTSLATILSDINWDNLSTWDSLNNWDSL